MDSIENDFELEELDIKCDNFDSIEPLSLLIDSPSSDDTNQSSSGNSSGQKNNNDANVEDYQLEEQQQQENLFDEYYSYHSCYSIYMNKCCRSEMQDRFQIIPKFDCEANISYLAVFDGHGSERVAHFLSQNLHNYLINYLEQSQYGDIEKAIMSGFSKIDEFVQNCKELLPEDSGSVVLCGIIYEKKLYLANLGDSKAIIIKEDNSYQNLTIEQTPARPDEKKRIEELGGWVIPVRNSQRLQGQIEISRAIGDKKYKPFIISEPEVTIYDLSQDDKYLILATDGLWKDNSSSDVAQFSKMSSDVSELSKLIFEQSQDRKIIKDNTTILCLDVQQYLQQVNQQQQLQQQQQSQKQQLKLNNEMEISREASKTEISFIE